MIQNSNTTNTYCTALSGSHFIAQTLYFLRALLPSRLLPYAQSRSNFSHYSLDDPISHTLRQPLHSSFTDAPPPPPYLAVA
jgi:hypothetical protein